MSDVEGHGDVAAAVQQAISTKTVVRGVGSGTWLHGGPVVHDGSVTQVRASVGVIEYTPGDLVITVHAGTTLEALSAICAEHGQMLAVAPYGSPRATLGAVIATASAAPLAYEDLTIRDLVLGLTVISGSGDVIRAGGRVVKNVAGFDLVRLHTGAFGTLGIITEVSIRLHAKPHMDHVVTGTLEDAPSAWVPRLIANRAPLPMLVRMAPSEPTQLFVRCAGNTARASALRGLMQSYGASGAFTLGPSDTSNASEPTLAASILRPVPERALVLRARTKPTEAAALIQSARDLFPEATLLFQPARGSVRIATPVTDDADVRIAALVRAATPSQPRSVVVEQGAPPCQPVSALDLSVKRAFDPHGLFIQRRPGVVT